MSATVCKDLSLVWVPVMVLTDVNRHEGEMVRTSLMVGSCDQLISSINKRMKENTYNQRGI